MSSVQGMDALQRRLKAIGETRPAMRSLQLSTIHEAQALVPRRTGLLRRRIVPGRLSDTEAVVEVRTPYAAAVEFGSKPHVILPKTKKALFFPSQKATTERFGPKAKLKFRLTGSLSAESVRKYGNAAFVHAKRVNHPGTKAKPYLVPGAKEAIRKAGIDAIVIDPWNGAA